MGRGQTDKETHTRTSRLLDQLGPEGRIGEEEKNLSLVLTYQLRLLKAVEGHTAVSVLQFCSVNFVNMAHSTERAKKALFRKCVQKST